MCPPQGTAGYRGAERFRTSSVRSDHPGHEHQRLKGVRRAKKSHQKAAGRPPLACAECTNRKKMKKRG